MKDGKVAILVVVAFALFVLPVAYVLSSGPAIWLVNRDYLSGGGWKTFYYPLSDLGPLDWSMVWYWNLWQEPASY